MLTRDHAAAQKRRFVWTTDLHSRFEAAVNTLGLDNAKPKSILRLMNVNDLTKANIKSHLQKYRCLMQKKAVTGHPEGQDSSDSAEQQKAATHHDGSRAELAACSSYDAAARRVATDTVPADRSSSSEHLRNASLPEQQLLSQVMPCCVMVGWAATLRRRRRRLGSCRSPEHNVSG